VNSDSAFMSNVRDASGEAMKIPACYGQLVVYVVYSLLLLGAGAFVYSLWANDVGIQLLLSTATSNHTLTLRGRLQGHDALEKKSSAVDLGMTIVGEDQLEKVTVADCQNVSSEHRTDGPDARFVSRTGVPFSSYLLCL
jgi:hypothetical protein